MSKNTKELSRETKEKAFKTYKGIINIFVIILLVQLYRALYVTNDEYYWVYAIGVLWFILRLAGFASRERKAAKEGIPVTEWMEKNGWDNNKNKNN